MRLLLLLTLAGTLATTRASAAPSGEETYAATIGTPLRLVTAGYDLRLRVWDVRTGRKLLEEKTGAVDVNGGFIASVNHKSVDLYDAATLKRRRKLDLGAFAGSVAITKDAVVVSSFIPPKGGVGDSRHFFSGFDPQTGARRFHSEGVKPFKLLYSDRNRIFATLDAWSSDLSLQGIDPASGALTPLLPHATPIRTVRFAERLLLTGESSSVVRVFDRDSLETLATLGDPVSGGGAKVKSLDVAEGALVACLGDSRVVYYAAHDAQPHHLTLAHGTPLAAAITPELVLVSSQTGSNMGDWEWFLTAYERGTWKERYVVKLADVGRMLLAEDDVVVVGSSLGARVLQTRDGEEIHDFRNEHGVAYLHFLKP